MDISVCGIQCEKCEEYGRGECGGCNGPETKLCNTGCKFRMCAKQRSVATCGHCPQFDSCEAIGAFHARQPQLRQNLLADKLSGGAAS